MILDIDASLAKMNYSYANSIKEVSQLEAIRDSIEEDRLESIKTKRLNNIKINDMLFEKFNQTYQDLIKNRAKDYAQKRNAYNIRYDHWKKAYDAHYHGGRVIFGFLTLGLAWPTHPGPEP